MSTSTVEIEVPFAQEVTVTDEALSVELSDGRTIAAPLGWYPRLVHATPSERNNWTLTGRGAKHLGRRLRPPPACDRYPLNDRRK